MNWMQTEVNPPKKEIFLLTNGSRIEVSSWSKDKKSIYGRILDMIPVISVYIPVSYIATNITKTYR